MTLWHPALSRAFARVRAFIACLFQRVDAPVGGNSRLENDQAEPKNHHEPTRDLAASLLTKIRDGLTGHSAELATFERDIDPASGVLAPRGPFAKMQRANQSLEELVEETVAQLGKSCGSQFSTECSRLEAYQEKTNAFGKKLTAVPDEPVMAQVVAELLGVVRELREENEAVRKEVAKARRELSLLATRASAAEREARLDALTQLLNRRAFDEVHEACHEASQDRPYCLLLLDADHFKSVNDRFGHPAGDAVLSLIGDRKSVV